MRALGKASAWQSMTVVLPTVTLKSRGSILHSGGTVNWVGVAK